MGAFLQELWNVRLYKRTQGRIVRQVTFAAIALIIAMGCWALQVELNEKSQAVRYAVPLALLAAGWWTAYRLVNMPQFADFLISVEAEMNKVAWPKRRELINASIVVILVIFLLAGMLFGFDLVLQWISSRISSLLRGNPPGSGE